MELTQNAVDEHPKKFTGPGYVYQDDEGIISFKLYVREFQNTTPGEEIDLYLKGGKPGTLYEDTRYYNLSFMSYSGDRWTVPRLLANPSWFNQGIYITGRVYSILRARNTAALAAADGAHYYRVHFFQNFDLPYTDYIDITNATEQVRSLHGAKFESEGRLFDIRQDDDDFIIQVSAKSPFPGNFYMRLIEALTYVSASQALWRVICVSSGSEEIFRLSSPRTHSPLTKLRRPIHTAGLHDRRMFWRLFSNYLGFSAQHAPMRGWHPCFIHIHNAIEASANSLDAWAIGLGVAVEGLARMVQIEDDPVHKKNCKILGARVKAFLQEMSWLDQSIGKRALGSLSRLNEPRVKERLEALIASKIVNGELLKAWQRCRHPSAHGAVIDIESAQAEEIQRMWHDLDCVTTLMYEITFHLVGYTESYTDYSADDWPTVPVGKH